MRGSDVPVATLALVASALVLAAPVAGRSGHPRLADVLMATAALSGVASFALAGFHTLRAARRRDARPGRRTEP